MVTPPPLLLGAAMAFWGWQTGMVWVGVILGVVLELPRFWSWRVEADLAACERAADLGTLLLLGVVAYGLLVRADLPVLLFVPRMLPLVLLPLVAVMRFGEVAAVPVGVLFWALRSRFVAGAPPLIPMGYVFVGVCLLAAGEVESRNAWYFPGVALLTAWGLWPLRSRRFRAWTWAGVVAVGVGVGFGLQSGLHALQGVMEEKVPGWLSAWLAPEADPYRTRTAMGELGRLKLSGRILFRVAREHPTRLPLRLREGVYTIFRQNEWRADPSLFFVVLAAKDPDRLETLTVYQGLARSKTMLPVPAGVVRVAGEGIESASANRHGVVRVHGQPGLLAARVWYSPDASLDAPPGEADLAVPGVEWPHLDRVVAELGLRDRPGPEAVRILAEYFQERFTYDTALVGRDPESTPIGAFLERDRRGHCEYFASATVLLLRRAGIPARYVAGYSVSEYDARERLFVARQRHGHAWAMAHVDGAWIEVDNTPEVWEARDAAGDGFWQPLLDGVSLAWFRLAEWRRAMEGDGWSWVAVGAAVWVFWRVGKWFARGGRRSRPETRVVRTPDDSPFGLVAERLRQEGWTRGIGEPWGSFLERCGRTGLREALRWHYGLRFDAANAEAGSAERLRASVMAWLSRTGGDGPVSSDSASHASIGGPSGRSGGDDDAARNSGR
ncbi:MAG: transglutaminase domain-containing protein [Magnetococcales bacterium]|nr:transglutaminase domain-containing protein [Magnetococcales bacterium]